MSHATAEMSYERPDNTSQNEVVDLGDLNSAGYTSTRDSTTPRTQRADIPDEVQPDREDGTEEGCRQLARTFFERYGYSTLGKFTKRGELSRVYLDTFASWSDGLEPRHFKQVLYALCVDGKVCRVVGNRGRFIRWNDPNRRSRPRSNGRNQNKPRNRNGPSEDDLVKRITAAVLAAQSKSN